MNPEPWLRGIVSGRHPVTGHLLRSSEQIREDLRAALSSLTVSQLWARPHGLTSAGFHAKHLAGSTARLCAYLEGRQLSAEQLARIPLEGSGDETAADLIDKAEASLARYESLVGALKPEDFGAVREVGRAKLKTTAIGLAIHIAEHGQRHAGQAISAARLAIQSAAPE